MRWRRSQRAASTPTWWRIPWGHLAEFTPELARERGLRIVGWTTDTHDWRGDSADDDARRRCELEHGGIVLAHDGVGVGRAAGARAQATAELVGPLVEQAREQGLEPGPLTPTWPVPIPVGNPELPSRGSAGGVTAVAVRDVLEEIAANAAALDAQPAFPHAAFEALQEAGALTPPPTRARGMGAGARGGQGRRVASGGSSRAI